MTEKLTPTQTLLIWCLLAKQGLAKQADIVPALDAADRIALEKAKLVTVAQPSRAMWITLADAGWAWAAKNLREPLPPPHGALHGMMCLLSDHLAETGEELTGFIGMAPTPPELEPKPPVEKARKASSATAPPPRKKTAPETDLSKPEAKQTSTIKKRTAKPKAAPEPKTSPKPKPFSKTALRKRIETAYLAITGNRKNESVRLARLRVELSDIDRATLDAGLGRILAGDKKATLTRHDDPRQLDQADREAAYNPAGEPFHVIWIAS